MSDIELPPEAIARQAEALARQVRDRRRFLGQTGFILQILAWLQMIASVIVGIVLATSTRETEGVWSSETDHPFVAYGLGVAIGGIAFGVLMLVIGTLAVYVTGRDAAAVFSSGAAT